MAQFLPSLNSPRRYLVMKILMLCYEYPPIGGGGAKVVHGLTHELRRKECVIDLVTMGFKDQPSFENIDNLNVYRVNCIRLNKHICTFPEMISYISLAFPLVLKLCNKNNYDINHTHFIFPDGILAYLTYKFTNLNYIITAHGSDVPGYNPNRFRMLHNLLKPVWNMIVKTSNKMVFPSKSLYDLFKVVDNKTQGIIIPNGINLKKYFPSKKKKKEILVVSRMFERKGIQYILKAFHGLKHDYILNIVGDGPYLEPLKSLSVEFKLDVNFLGFIDNQSIELKRLFEGSEIFIFTSESENFPIVLLEAMLSGMAIITTLDTGCAEVVGDAAILIDSKNSNAIKEALIRLITDCQLRRDLQKAARKRVEEYFGWSAIANKYIELYKIYGKKNE